MENDNRPIFGVPFQLRDSLMQTLHVSSCSRPDSLWTNSRFYWENMLLCYEGAALKHPMDGKQYLLFED